MHSGIFNLCNKTNKGTCIKCVLSYIINLQHVSVAFAIIFRAALQKYQEDNNVEVPRAYFILGTFVKLPC